MSSRDAAPLTVRLLARKPSAAPSGPAQPPPTKAAPPTQPLPTKAAPRVQNIHAASPTLHTVDLTPPDFLRANKRRDETS